MLQEIKQRKIDGKKALKLVGVSKINFLDYPDNELDLVPFLKIVKNIETEIKKTKCNVIFTHHHNDLNIDHRIAYEATITAARPLPTVPSPHHLPPNVDPHRLSRNGGRDRRQGP